jgi:hypothetical protein
MKKLIKNILYLFNFIALGIAIYWFKEEQSPEPLIVIISQVLVLITLIFESKISKLGISKISNSEVDVDVKSSDDSNIDISDVKDGSKVKIKRR